jgi:hypothetical protein
MSHDLPRHLHRRDVLETYPGSGHSHTNALCPICGFKRQEKGHRVQREKCSKEMQVRYNVIEKMIK